MSGLAYRRLDSPLHAARAGAGGLYCAVLGGAAIATDSPLLLGVLGLCVLGAARGARSLRAVGSAMRFAVPLALAFALLNPFVSRNGLTVIARLGEIPPLGQVDLTLEALVYGLVFGLRVVVVIGAFALLTAVVDPDELLALFARVSPRSALTAVLATRLFPVLTRDAQRVDDARRCRADGGGSGPGARLAVVRAVTAGALDRSLDVAATLEVRGYGSGSRPPRRALPWSRHDRAFLVSALAVTALVAWALLSGIAAFEAYPELAMTAGPRELLLAAALLLVALLPFADRRGVAR